MLSLILLLFFFPILVLLYILIRAKLGSPVFFIQKRAGLKGKTFNLIKFRTMLDVKDSEGLPLPDKDRMTSFGNFLRSTSLDELPEIFNVLKMDMSFVGPRPLLVEYIPLYSKEQMCRHNTKPGITGWAQVNGRNAISWGDKFKFDIWYVNNRSFWLDVKILLITLKKVISREGVYYSKSSTMPIFTGNDTNKNEK
jgi:sugar transferase EpsL